MGLINHIIDLDLVKLSTTKSKSGLGNWEITTKT